MPENKIATPIPAATLILVRGDSGPLEVYLTRRNQNLKFLGGFYVFTGGKRDHDDISAASLERMKAADLGKKARAVEGAEPEAQKLGFYAAAIREAFEEAGILIACDQTGAQIRPDEKLKSALGNFRGLLHARKIGFLSILTELNLYYDLEALSWFAHWVTPKTSPRRFDTQFFIAESPSSQSPEPHSEEIDDALWIGPSEALEAWKQGKLKMIPPTLASLDRLSRFTSLAELAQKLKNPGRA